MSRGILIFAFNNSTFNYFGQACWVADRVERFLGIETTIVTDQKSVSNTKHNVVITDAIGSNMRNFDTSADGMVDTWYNGNRYQADALSPYDETIVIDSDYVVNSSQLNLLFDSPHDFLCHRYATDLTYTNSLQHYDSFGKTKVPHYWATVLFFRKSYFSKTVFDTILMVKDSYRFYSNLYHFPSQPFRNDFAVSIALTIVYGHRLHAIPSIPWNLPTIVTNANVAKISDTEYELSYTKHTQDRSKRVYTLIKDQDFHCINKVDMEKLVNGS